MLRVAFVLRSTEVHPVFFWFVPLYIQRNKALHTYWGLLVAAAAAAADSSMYSLPWLAHPFATPCTHARLTCKHYACYSQALVLSLIWRALLAYPFGASLHIQRNKALHTYWGLLVVAGAGWLSPLCASPRVGPPYS